jgi:uroporphyrinogen decarboxylase
MSASALTSRERVLHAYERRGYDRTPVKHEATPEVNRLLMDHFGLANMEQVLRMVGDDFRYVEPVYCGPPLRTFPDGSIEGYFGERYKRAQFEGGTYLEACYLPYAGIATLDRLDRSHFPSADWFDYSTIRQQCEAWGGRYALCFGTPGDMDFINSISRARGMEEVLMDLLDDNEVFLEIMQARYEFYYEMHRRVLEAAGGMIDFAHIGEDLGNQRGPMISHEIFERHFAPKFQQYFAMAHGYGARTMMHMCGCVESFLPRLIELGLDVQDVVQPTTPEMDIARLQARYGERLTFCGTMCVQTTLAHGTAAEVEREVRRRLELFPRGGLFLGPTHAIQVGSPLENVLALYRAAGSLREDVDDSIRAIAGGAEPEKVNLSKLF